MLELGLRTVQPLCLLKLISYFAHGTEAIDSAYLYAGGVVACSALNVFIMHPYMLGTMHVGMQMRVGLCSMIYRKALKLSKTALGETTAGHIVNLISNDVGRLDLATIFVHYLWVGPLETLFITYLMYLEVSWKIKCDILQIFNSSAHLLDWNRRCVWCSLYAAIHTTAGVARKEDFGAETSYGSSN